MDADLIQQYCHEGLTWIGFGVVSGLIAKAIMPGRDPGGAVVTMVLGLAGALIGASIYAWSGGDRIKQLISPLGFAVSVAGSLVLLLVHRLFSGRVIGIEGADGRTVRSPYYRNRRRVRVVEED